MGTLYQGEQRARPTGLRERAKIEEPPNRVFAILKSTSFHHALPAAMAWAMSVNSNVLAHGKSLSLWQAADALEVGVQNPEDVRILRVPSLPEPDCPQFRLIATQAGLDFSASLGMALGYAVLIRHCALGSRRVLRHQFRHVAQCERLGSVNWFLEEYLGQLVQHGYCDAPLEVDARRHEGRLRESMQPPLRANG